jgi:uncharacterized OB-fold protein
VPPTTVCPDCGGELAPVKLFGRGSENPFSGAAIDTELSYYTDADAQRGTWLGMFTERGRVRTTLCQSCRRLFLHGFPG